MVLAVVGGICQDATQLHSRRAIDDHRSKVRRIIGGSQADLCGEPEVARRVTKHRELGVVGIPEGTGVRPLG